MVDRPQVKRKIDWAKVIETCEYMMQEIEDGEYHEDNDYDTYITESVLRAIYGQEVYEYINTWESRYFVTHRCKKGNHEYAGIRVRCIWCDCRKDNK